VTDARVPSSLERKLRLIFRPIDDFKKHSALVCVAGYVAIMLGMRHFTISDFLAARFVAGVDSRNS
jgi:hypothetical protein